MLFQEPKKDYEYIYKLEKNIKAYMFYIIIALAVISISLSIAITGLTPLKEKQPYLMYFNSAESNFVSVRPANENIQGNQALLKGILAGYVKNRETINRIDDMERYEITRIQSKNMVWSVFQNIVSMPNSIYSTPNIYRDIKIINVAILNNETATIDFASTEYNQARTHFEQKKYRASIKFEFKDNVDTYSSIQNNPTGFVVNDYVLSSIEEFDELTK